MSSTSKNENADDSPSSTKKNPFGTTNSTPSGAKLFAKPVSIFGVGGETIEQKVAAVKAKISDEEFRFLRFFYSAQNKNKDEQTRTENNAKCRAIEKKLGSADAKLLATHLMSHHYYDKPGPSQKKEKAKSSNGLSASSVSPTSSSPATSPTLATPDVPPTSATPASISSAPTLSTAAAVSTSVTLSTPANPSTPAAPPTRGRLLHYPPVYNLREIILEEECIQKTKALNLTQWSKNQQVSSSARNGYPTRRNPYRRRPTLPEDKIKHKTLSLELAEDDASECSGDYSDGSSNSDYDSDSYIAYEDDTGYYNLEETYETLEKLPLEEARFLKYHFTKNSKKRSRKRVMRIENYRKLSKHEIGLVKYYFNNGQPWPAEGRPLDEDDIPLLEPYDRIDYSTIKLPDGFNLSPEEIEHLDYSYNAPFEIRSTRNTILKIEDDGIDKIVAKVGAVEFDRLIDFICDTLPEIKKKMRYDEMCAKNLEEYRLRCARGDRIPIYLEYLQKELQQPKLPSKVNKEERMFKESPKRDGSSYREHDNYSEMKPQMGTYTAYSSCNPASHSTKNTQEERSDIILKNGSNLAIQKKSEPLKKEGSMFKENPTRNGSSYGVHGNYSEMRPQMENYKTYPSCNPASIQPTKNTEKKRSEIGLNNDSNTLIQKKNEPMKKESTVNPSHAGTSTSESSASTGIPKYWNFCTTPPCTWTEEEKTANFASIQKKLTCDELHFLIHLLKENKN